MTEPSLGTKRKCQSCGTAFFDLQHDPIVCPRCKAVFTPPPEPPVYKRKTHAPAERVRAEEPEAIVEQDSEAPIEDGPEEPEPDEEPDDDILPLQT